MDKQDNTSPLNPFCPNGCSEHLKWAMLWSQQKCRIWKTTQSRLKFLWGKNSFWGCHLGCIGSGQDSFCECMELLNIIKTEISWAAEFSIHLFIIYLLFIYLLFIYSSYLLCPLSPAPHSASLLLFLLFCRKHITE